MAGPFHQGVFVITVGKVAPGRVGTWEGPIGGGLCAFREIGTHALPPEPVPEADIRAWDCGLDDHLVTLWVERSSGIEEGECSVCLRVASQTIEMSDVDRKIVCGTCEGAGFIKSLVQRAYGLRGTKPCPACFAINADR